MSALVTLNAHKTVGLLYIRYYRQYKTGTSSIGIPVSQCYEKSRLYSLRQTNSCFYVVYSSCNSHVLPNSSKHNNSYNKSNKENVQKKL